MDEISLATQHAPILHLHPREQYFPMDPVRFIRLARFRHHRNYKKDQGWNKRKAGWVTGDKHDKDYYGIPIGVIDSFGPPSPGRNRRPYDPKAGRNVDVFLQTDAHESGVRKPTGSVGTYFRLLRRKSRMELQYWFFYGYNKGYGGFNHQGDWESVRFRFIGEKLRAVTLSSHGDDKEFQPRHLQYQGGRLHVFVAVGTHAIYARAGDFPIKWKGFQVATDECRAGGVSWDTRKVLLNLNRQNWRNYAGAWGEVGSGLPPWNEHTTGPLGPWHKTSSFV